MVLERNLLDRRVVKVRFISIDRMTAGRHVGGPDHTLLQYHPGLVPVN